MLFRSGHNDPDKEPYMARLAMIQTRADIPAGLKILEKILITDQPPKKVHSLSPVVERVPLPSKEAGGKVNVAA